LENISEQTSREYAYWMHKFVACNVQTWENFLGLQCVRFIFKIAKTLPIYI